MPHRPIVLEAAVLDDRPARVGEERAERRRVDVVVAEGAREVDRAVEADRVDGLVRIGGQRLSAQRLTARLEGSRVIRHARYPVTLEVSVVTADELPLHGVVLATYRSRTTWEHDEHGEPLQSVRDLAFTLEACGRAADGSDP